MSVESTEEEIKTQIEILSNQMEIHLGGVWESTTKDNLLKTANKVKQIVQNSNGFSKNVQIDKTLNILNRAKVKAIMSSDKEYYSVCQKIDSIITSLNHCRGN
jgi:hypothetical protein